MEKMSFAFPSSSSSCNDNEIEIITPSVAASAQSTSTHYDVFINHRGKDVKSTLASHMYNIFKDCGIRVFLDKPEMQPGELIISQIQDAIRTASVNVAIFSENYARSSWCLDELCWMMRTPTKLLPVFHDVEPSDLRWTDKVDGVYARSLRELQQKHGYNSQRIGEWKEALFNASNRSGVELKAFNGDEGALLKYIVQNVLKRMEKAPLEAAKHPVGLNELTEDFERTLLQGRNEECVKVVGIVGMGGAGKTTLAKHLYNVKQSHYEKSCFLFDIRSNDLKDLQRELLKELTGLDIKIRHTSEGIGVLNKHLSISCCRALIVLDDIDHQNQLDALLAVKDVVSSDSVIVVTSRYKDVLRQSGITLLYNIKNLNRRQAQELLCWHAFLRPFPLQGFEDFVDRFLTACDGLPLSLKVFGGQLYGNTDKNYWECQLQKISNIIHPDIRKTLKVSYDALDRNDKQIFLDIACFFIGEDKSTAIRIWDGCGWDGWIGLQMLEQRCLVEFDHENRIRMHDHLRDLGRDIVDEQCWGNPNEPRRLWRPIDINDLLERRSVSMQAIRGIVSSDVGWSEPSRTNFGWYNRWIELLGNCLDYWCRLKFGISGWFGGVSGLQLLVGESDLFKGILNSTSSRSLVWLRWHRCPHKSLPVWLSMDKLRVLELVGGSLETLWNGHKQIPTQLRELRVEGSNKLTKIPRSIEVLNHLEKIILKESSMKTLPDEFCRLHSLKHLQLEYLDELQSLPERFGDLTSLQHLNLWDCNSLQTLPDSFSQLIQLRYLRLRCRNLLIRRDILGQISTLEYIYFSFCEKLEVLPSQITGQQCLEEIHLGRTSLKELPNEIGELGNLKVLWLSMSFLTSLPPSLWNLRSLVRLRLDGMVNTDGCWNLQTLRGVEQLERLKDLQLSAGDGQGIRWLQTLPPRLSTATVTTRTIKAEECAVEGIFRSFSTSLELDSTDSAHNWIKLQGIRNLKSCTAAILCFVTTASDPDAGYVRIRWRQNIHGPTLSYGVRVKEGVWISMSIFTRNSEFLRNFRDLMSGRRRCRSSFPRAAAMSIQLQREGQIEVKKGWIAMGRDGEEGTILQLWNKLICYVSH